MPELTKERLAYLNKMHGVTESKVKKIKTFITALIDLVDSTYLGDELYGDIDEFDGHFYWCITNITGNEMDKSKPEYLFIKDIFIFSYYDKNDGDRVQDTKDHFDLFLTNKGINMEHYEIFVNYYNNLVVFID